ncbi:transcription initiation factor TFIID subunit 8 [Carica papaya]|uniref:transcription initiation factor TFIID subunit 8 n=1 Tax=Carica papaya TaxID=3649 RepID=UPI000B8D1BF6|nr:transcription initiation factor TFIID subunit 8 [Carica papaya]
MSHEGGEGTRENELRDNASTTRPGSDDFGRAVSKVAVAQICESLGYGGFKDSALQALADIAIQYIRELGKTARFYANLAGRTECNFFDIIWGFEDLGEAHWLGASEKGNSVMVSRKVMEIIQFLSSTKEIPFAQPVPRYPVIRSRRMTPSFVQMGETPPGKHIPTWLPAFPDPHTYKHTPMWNERVSDPRADKIEQARQRRKAERALLSLQQRLVCNDSRRTSDWGFMNNEKEEMQEVGNNPFHATPSELEKKNVSPVAPVSGKVAGGAMNGNHLSLLEAFAPAIEAVKCGFSEDGDVERNELPDERPAIHFKLRTGKKIMGEYLDKSLHNRKGDQRAVPFLRDEERDDKKRRAEFILKQCMENPSDLNQL